MLPLNIAPRIIHRTNAFVVLKAMLLIKKLILIILININNLSKMNLLYRPVVAKISQSLDIAKFPATNVFQNIDAVERLRFGDLKPFRKDVICLSFLRNIFHIPWWREYNCGQLLKKCIRSRSVYLLFKICNFNIFFSLDCYSTPPRLFIHPFIQIGILCILLIKC